MRVRRYDRGELRRSHRTDEGYLYAEGYAVRAGVLTYVNADGSTFRELVTEDELRNADSLGTLGNKPITLEHPDEFVNADNQRDVQVGTVGQEIDVEGGFVKVRLAVHADAAVKAVDSGKVELSPGYTVELDMTPGVHPEHGPYDAIQRNRRYNHLAIVDAARGGSQVRLRADAAMQVRDDSAPEPGTGPRRAATDSQENQMNPNIARLLAVLGLSAKFDSEDDALAAGLNAIEALKAKADGDRADDMAEELAELKAKLAAMEAEMAEGDDEDDESEDMAAKYEDKCRAYDELKGEHDAMKAELDAMKEELDAMKKAEEDRKDAAALEALKPLCGWLKVDTDGKDLATVRKDAAAAFLGDVPDNASEQYLDGALKAASKHFEARADGAAWAGFRPRKQDGSDDHNREDGADVDLSQTYLKQLHGGSK